MMPYVEVYEQHRPHLLGVAYRMLGAMGDAEDVLQDAFLHLTISLGHTVVIAETGREVLTRHRLDYCVCRR